MWFETLSRSFCSREHNTFHEKCQLLPELAMLLYTSLQLSAHLSNQLRFGLRAPFEGQNIVYKFHSREHNTFQERWHLLFIAHPNRSRFYPKKLKLRTFQIISNLKLSFLMWFETLSRCFCSRENNTFHEKCQLLPELAMLLYTSLQLSRTSQISWDSDCERPLRVKTLCTSFISVIATTEIGQSNMVEMQ